MKGFRSVKARLCKVEREYKPKIVLVWRRESGEVKMEGVTYNRSEFAEWEKNNPNLDVKVLSWLTGYGEVKRE